MSLCELFGTAFCAVFGKVLALAQARKVDVILVTELTSWGPFGPIAVGTSIAECPRTDPGGRDSRTGLPPRVVNDETHEQLRVHSRLGHVYPAQCPARALLSHVPLGPLSWLHQLRPSCPGLFAGFSATMKRSDFSCPCFIGFDSSSSRCGPL